MSHQTPHSSIVLTTPNPAGDRNITVRACIDAFLLQRQASGHKSVRDDRTVLVGPGQRVTGKRSAGPSLAQTELAHLPIRRLTAQDFRLWFDARHPEWMAASTRKRGMSTMRQFLDFVVRNGWGDLTLMAACSRTAASEARRDWLRPEQIPALTRLMQDPRFDDYDRFGFETLLRTGVRISEFVVLRANDLNLQEETLTVRRGKGRGDGKHRYVPVDAEYVALWHEHTRTHSIGAGGWMFYRRQARQVPGPRGSYEFVEDRQNHCTPKPMRSRLDTLTELAREQLDPTLAPAFTIGPHVLRRTFACLHAVNIELGLGGLGWLGLQEAMGHSDLQITTEYLHDVEPYLRRFRRSKGIGQVVRDILQALDDTRQ